MTGLAAAPVSAAEFKLGNLTVENPWAEATSGRARSGSVYLTILNRGDMPDRLVSASSPAAARTEIHRTAEKDGRRTMRPVGALTLRAGASMLLRPGGLHVMLLGLAAPLTLGGSFNLTLTFENAGSVTVRVEIEKIGARQPPDGR
jgi:periplasmic copper chaperone A